MNNRKIAAVFMAVILTMAIDTLRPKPESPSFTVKGNSDRMLSGETTTLRGRIVEPPEKAGPDPLAEPDYRYHYTFRVEVLSGGFPHFENGDRFSALSYSTPPDDVAEDRLCMQVALSKGNFIDQIHKFWRCGDTPPNLSD